LFVREAGELALEAGDLVAAHHSRIIFFQSARHPEPGFLCAPVL
jgi:hypothetical protein